MVENIVSLEESATSLILYQYLHHAAVLQHTLAGGDGKIPVEGSRTLSEHSATNSNVDKWVGLLSSPVR